MYSGLQFRNQSWRLRAKCFNTPEPEKWDKGGTGAKKHCNGCTVISECLTYALENDIKYGIWGALTPNERKRLRRQMNRFLSKIEKLKKEQLQDAAEPPIAS